MTQDSPILLSEEIAKELLNPLAEKLTDLGLSFLLVIQGPEGKYYGNSSPHEETAEDFPRFLAEALIRNPYLCHRIKGFFDTQVEREFPPTVSH